MLGDERQPVLGRDASVLRDDGHLRAVREGKGLSLSIYDGSVAQAGLMGANREYIEREIPHIWSVMRSSIDEVLESSDVVVIGNGAPKFREIQSSLKTNQIVVDLVRALEPQPSDDDHYRGICW